MGEIRMLKNDSHCCPSPRAGIGAALAAALLFGAAAPLTKVFLADLSPWLAAALLYLGAGIGLTAYRLIARLPTVRMNRVDAVCFAGAVVAGGILGPVLLMIGLTRMASSGASLLLNVEGVFTTLLAWCVFKEHLDARIAFGMLCILAAVVVWGWPEALRSGTAWPILAILAACLAWSIDNNLTRKVSETDATWIAATKGLVAGLVNLGLAAWIGWTTPAWPQVLAVMVIGFFAYGVSVALFVTGLRYLGSARTGAYFSAAPFFCAPLAVAMGDPVTSRFVLAGSLMAIGISMHLRERHVHEHVHEALEHDHFHTHDAHHDHAHDPPVPTGTRHRHRHRHVSLVHRHAHFPDSHHRHDHG